MTSATFTDLQCLSLARYQLAEIFFSESVSQFMLYGLFLLVIFLEVRLSRFVIFENNDKQISGFFL